jgi:PPM family protein phosphatase
MDLQNRLARLLSRGIEPRHVRSLIDPPIIMATELGKRTENQDRVAVMRMRSASRPNHSAIAVAISDGMGGMQDGGTCASLTVAAFFEALQKFRTLPAPDRLHQATLLANETVHGFAKGRGGATLSAVVVEPSEAPFLVNVGDSRVYGDLMPSKGRRTLDRLTTDDSLAEAFGAEDRDLLQFIGMGEGIQPHVGMVSADVQALLLTTDGVHFLDQVLLSHIFLQADTLRQAVERLAALARWFGGSDNATIAAFAPKEILQHSADLEEGVLEIWTPCTSIQILSSPGMPSSMTAAPSEPEQPSVLPNSLKSKARSSRIRKAKTQKRAEQETKPKSEQLKIEIEVGNGDLANADRGKV